MKKCPQCQASMPDTEKFCMRCGKELAQVTTPEPQSSEPLPAVNAKTPPAPKSPTVYRSGQKKSSKALIWILVVVIVVVVALVVLFFTGVFKFGQSLQDPVAVEDSLSAQVEVNWEGEGVLPTAFYTNATEKLLKVSLKADKPVTVNVSVEIPQVTEKETKTIEVSTSSKSYNFKPSFLQAAYGSLGEAQDKYIKLEVTDETGALIIDESISIMVASRDDMVWVEDDGSQNYKYIAKWVTKDAPEVKELVRVAADYNEAICGQPAMVGYLGDETMVACQMASLFAAMQDYYKIKYIASTESYQTSNAQKIKLPEDVIIERSGLCIETTVLMAAALENLGMEPVIIIVPGHAWVAVKAYAGAPYYFHLETTMLDASVLDAMTAGEDNWYYDGGSAIAVVDIKKMREEGILPFGSTSGDPSSL